MSAVVVEYPYDEPPPEGAARQVAEGIWWVRMPLPFVLDHINLYLLEDGDGWTVVDCGLNKDGVRDLWETLIRTLLAGRPVRRVIVTHFHPDHMGLAQWLLARFPEAELWMSLAEWLWSHFAFDARERNMEEMLRFWRRNGMATTTVDAMRGRGNFYAQNVVRPPIVYRRIQHGDTIRIGEREWQAITGSGHSPEHVCLACPESKLLISGDQVLPRITTNVSVHFVEPDGDPLQQFLDSTRAFAHLPDDTFTLCSHDRPFYGLHERLAQLRDHHRVRLDDGCEALAEPRHAIDLLPVFFHRPLDLHQQSFAIGESIAHLHNLWSAGRAGREQGPDGVFRFVQA